MLASIYNFFSSIHNRISLLLKALLILGAVFLFIAGQYQAVVETLLILCITFMPLVLDARLQVKIPYEFETLAILFAYLSLFLGEVLDFYNRFWWWDIVLHISSGFLLGITGFLLVYVLNEDKKINFDLSPFFIALFAFMFAMGFGGIWEIFEFSLDELFGLNMQKSGLQDTMWDLIVDAIGALFISILGYRFLLTKESDSFLERWIDKFIVANPKMFSKTGSHDSGKHDS
ncbi:MAG: hypothetical protein P8M72_10240 [Gammaproteobacteria bacterium]|jgi:hypothetical protein|nr:hypothetical protein [Gammaproteobacteria bacterium]